MLRRLIFSLALLGVTLRAHDAGLSTARAVLGNDRIEVTVAYATADIRAMLPGYGGPNASKNSAELTQQHAALEEIASVLCALRIADKSMVPLESRVELVAGDNVAFHYTFSRVPGTTSFVYEALNLRALPSTHREHFQALGQGGAVIAEKVLSAQQPTCSVSLSAPVALGAPGVPPSFFSFFVLGVEHIWTGYDHLLFLFGLLVVCRSFRSIVVIVTCFTLAHSLTLGLATLNLVSVPSWLVEPLIAASIVFVGVENLLRRGAEPGGRGWLTFGFGLIHGFGFASVLRDRGVGADGGGIALPLVSFNLGVEAGQVCVAAVVLPILVYLFREDKVRRRGVPVASAAVAVAGLYWLIERTLLS